MIVSPYVSRRRTEQMLQYLQTAVSNNVPVIILTRPYEDYGDKDTFILRQTLDALNSEGINLLFRANIHQKFAVIDERIVWYGSINLLSFGNAEESIMRLESSNIANELLRSIDM